MKKSFLSVLLFAMGACNSGPAVFSDYDATQSFFAYKTFSWAHTSPLIRSGDLPVSEKVEDRATKAIKDELESKGFRYVTEPSSANFLVAYTLGARENVDIYQVDSSVYENQEKWLWGKEYHPYFLDGMLAEDDLTVYTKGVISIDIFDNTTKAPVWHGKASKPLSEAEISSEGGSVEVAVKDVLSNFPPQD